MKVATKLTAAFALHVALLAALLIYHVGTIRDVVSSSYELTEISSRVYSTATEQAVRITQLEENAAKHMITRDQGYLAKFDELAAAFSSELAQLREQPLTAREQADLDAVTQQWVEFQAYADRLHRSGDAVNAADSLVTLQAHLDALRVQTQHMSEASHEAMLAQLGRPQHALAKVSG